MFVKRRAGRVTGHHRFGRCFGRIEGCFPAAVGHIDDDADLGGPLAAYYARFGLELE